MWLQTGLAGLGKRLKLEFISVALCQFMAIASLSKPFIYREKTKRLIVKPKALSCSKSPKIGN